MDGSRERGMALVAALLVAAVIAGIAVALTARDRYAILAVTRGREMATVDALVQELEVAAARALAQDAEAGTHDSADEAWHTRTFVAGRDGFEASARLEDVQRRFNLNSLVVETPPDAGGGEAPEVTPGTAGPAVPAASPAARRAMLDFARSAGVAAPTATDGGKDAEAAGLRTEQIAAARFALLLRALDLPASLLPAVLDWLDADGETRFPDGAEDDYYSRQRPAYRAANGRFEDVSELRLVRGVNEEIYGRLAPFITVLDDPGPINVNTAPPEILMTLGPGIDRGTAEMLVVAREAQPFTDLETLLRHPALAGRAVLPEGLATGTQWFELDTRVDHDDLPYFRRSLLHRMEPSRIFTLRRERRYSDG